MSRSAAAPSRPDRNDQLRSERELPLISSHILDHLETILLLTALAVVVLVYPLRLDRQFLDPLAMTWIKGATAWARFTRDQFEAILSFYFSPLILKGTLALAPLLAFTALRAIRWTLQCGMRNAECGMETRLEAGGRRPDENTNIIPHSAFRIPHFFSVLAFFGWVAVSAAWSPTPRIAWAAAVWVLIFGAFMFALLRRGLSASEAAGLARLAIALGAVVMAIAFLESVPIFREKIFLIMFPFEDPRNRFGSLLGHNTAAGSYLMMTAFPAWTGLLAARTTGRRVLYGVYLVALLYAELVLQSRAVWIFLPVLGLLALRSTLRAAQPASRLRWLPAGLLAALTLALLTQTIDRPWNPLYVRNNPLSKRLHDLSLEGLRSESRVRLNVISATLVPRHPLAGHGLYAFQYVYPKRQAEYFAAHPDSTLNQTVNRSHMAHNEYMQVTVDHGLIGLALLLWMLGEIALRGWRVRRELSSAGILPAQSAGWKPALLHEGLGWGALAFVLHAGVDFPFHIPQLAIPGVLCLAAWGSFRMRNAECGMRNEKEMRNAECGMRNEESNSTFRIPHSAFARVPRFRPAVFARLLAVFLIALAVPLGAFPLIKCLQGDVSFMRGAAYRQTYYDYRNKTAENKGIVIGESANFVNAIRSDLRLTGQVRDDYQKQAAQVLNELRREGDLAPETQTGLMRQTLTLTNTLVTAKAQPETVEQGERLLSYLKQFDDFVFEERVDTLRLSVRYFNEALELAPYNDLTRLELAEDCHALGTEYLKQAARTGGASDAANAAARWLKAGIQTLNEAIKGMNYHTLYWLRAQLWRQMVALEPAGDAWTHYVADVKRAVYFCPCAAEYTAALLEILAQDKQADPATILQLKKHLNKADPYYLPNHDFIQAMVALRDLRYGAAAAQLDELLKVDPANLKWMNHAARAHLLAGNIARARELILAIRQAWAPSLLADGGLLVEKALQWNYRELLRWFQDLPQSDPENRAEFRAIEDEARRRLGRTGEKPIYDRPADMPEAQWALRVAEAAPGVLNHYFFDTARARQAFSARLAMGGAPSLRFWVEGFYLGQAMKDPALMQRCLEQARAFDAAAPVLPDLQAILGKTGPIAQKN